jgi:hypothetical protein
MNKKLITIAIILFTFIATSNICAQPGNLRAGEFLIDTTVVYVPATKNQASAHIATDDTTAFVVWNDTRAGGWDIYGARIDENGNLLDPAGILIGICDQNDPYPDVAFDGTNYLVVWHDAETSGQYDIYGMRVSKEGELLDPEPFIISDATGAQMSPRVAFDGTNYLVVWYDSRGGSYDIYGTRVDQNGTVLNSAGIPISTAADYQYFPDVSFDGTNYMVVWQDQRSGEYDIYGSRVDQDGIVLNSPGIPISTASDEQNRPSIDFDGTNYLVVWDDYRSGSEYDIYGTFLDTAGNVSSPSGIIISNAADNQQMPSVSFDGTNYLVAWHDHRDGGGNYDIYGARVNTSGTVQDPSGIPIANIDAQQLTAVVISYSGQWLAVWRDNQNGGYTDIYGSRISSSGTVTDGDGILISSSAQDQRNPAVASDGTNYLVVWEEARSGGFSPDIYGMLIDASGEQLNEDAIAISTSTGNQAYPAVAFDNDSIYLVVWQDDRSGSGNDIYGTRVSTSGNVLDPPGIAISTATGRQNFPSIAFDGTNFLVVWADERGGSVSTDDIYGTLVEPDGSVLSPSGNVIADDPNWQDNPSVAFDGTNYLVVWGNYATGSFNADIYGVRVNQSGYPVDASSFAIMVDDYGQWFPVVDFDGTNYLVVWDDRRNGNGTPDIYGTIVTPHANVLNASGLPIIPYSGSQNFPFIVFDGTNYLVGCQNSQSETAQNVLGAAVNTGGSVSEIYTIASFNIEPYQTNPAAASGGGSQILVVFPNWAEDIDGNPSNAIRIWGKLRASAGIDEDDNITAKNGKFDLNVSPNITQGICNITFVHSASTPVTLKIFNTAGILLNERIVGNSAGAYDLNIDMNNLPNGTYFFNVSSNDLQETEKAVLVK